MESKGKTKENSNWSIQKGLSAIYSHSLVWPYRSIVY